MSATATKANAVSITSIPQPTVNTPNAPQITPILNKHFKISGNDINKLYASLTPMRSDVTHRVQKDLVARAGAVNIGKEIIDSNPSAKVGVMIAGNSGLPGGALGSRPDAVTEADLMLKTQEESIWANAILTACGTNPVKQQQFHDNTIGGKWGMVDGPTGRSTMTKQGIDFTSTENVSDYNGIYLVNDCELSSESRSDKTNIRSSKYIEKGKKYPVVFAFADSINANAAIGTSTGTMKRTLNKRAIEDYDFFRDCIKEKLRSALDGMASQGVTHPLVARLSCGIYAGKHGARVNSDFDNILREVLSEEVGPNSEQRGRYFEDVIIPEL
jgi:hypothetical protein